MGFLDKAKKMAEQAQAKLDEAQQQFNSSQPGGAQGGAPAVEYDKHGRPIPQQPPVATPGVPPTGQGDPLGAAAAAPAPPPPAGPPVAQPGVPPTGTAPTAPPPAPPIPPAPVPEPEAAAPVAPPAPAAPPEPAPATEPAAPGNAGVPEDRNRPSYEPPKLSSGDPLAG